MDRRDFLKGVGATTVAGGAYGVYAGIIDTDTIRDKIQELELPNGGGDSDPMHQKFGVLADPFEQLEWNTNGHFTLTIASDHNIDGFGVKHEKVEEDNYDSYTFFREVPFAGGEVTVDFEAQLDTVYPTREFTLVGAGGDSSGVHGFSRRDYYHTEFHCPRKCG